MEIRIDRNNRNLLSISFGYDADLVAAVKRLPGARWNSDRRCWTVPAVHVKTVIAFGREHGAHIDPAVEALIATQAKAVEASTATTDAPAADAVAALDLPASITEAMRPYQRGGVVYMLAHRKAFQADEMGLGKTLQSLAATEACKGYPELTLAPASLLRNWGNETARWLPHRRVQVITKSKTAIDPTAEIVIVSYDVAKNHDGVKSTRWVTVIADESHAL